ncbi:hypothetical protein PQO01_08765 [Lentisphaera marina]|uniref:hypothetical protein n=1 Tax=Lentisphaera marina TaxID=1111041 RepID=UPI002366E4E9|nr:hypothetical protein [Lentisphaera marina]MDD7985037.1 hypothetical protein [Lentisphaera marina]
MKCISAVLLLLSTQLAFAVDLGFLSADGSEMNSDNIPKMIVTEHLKEQGKLIQEGEITKQWASYGKCQEVW